MVGQECPTHVDNRVPVELLEGGDVEVGRDQLDVGLQHRPDRSDLRARGGGGEAVEVEEFHTN
jgi:hypothetical protein